MTDYIIVPKTEPLPKDTNLLRQINDEVWKNHVFSYLMQYCKDVDKKEISKIIEQEKAEEMSNIEREIKKHIKKWFNRKRNISFWLSGIKLKRETHSESYLEGFIDLEFFHSFWGNEPCMDKSFPFECKNIEAETKSKLNKSIKEYIYNPSKNDGGVYRYLTKKYSPEQDFGGMIGFLISGNLQKVIDKIIKKLGALDISDKHIGKLTDNGVVINSIAGNKNTFNSTHNCYNYQNKMHSTVLLHHIIIDFQSD